jgi:hypothetical protein
VDIEDIKSSGLLELYVLDQLSPAEKAEVEGYLTSFPELRSELREIERSLEIYASAAAIKAPAGVKDRILEEIRKQGPVSNQAPPRSGSPWGFIAALLGIGLLILGYFFYQKNNEATALQREIQLVRDTCETTTEDLTHQLDLLKQLTQQANRIINFQPTPGFAATDLYLHINPLTQRTFIQVRNLPDIAGNHQFQLWSIRPNQPPTPLNVFDAPADGLIEVTYVEGTEVYAITIEERGGVQTPTMENLIGTVSVAGIN